MHWCTAFYHNDDLVTWRAILEQWLEVGWGIKDINYDYNKLLRLAEAWHNHPSTRQGQELRLIDAEASTLTPVMKITPRPPRPDFILTKEEFSAMTKRFLADQEKYRAERASRGN